MSNTKFEIIAIIIRVNRKRPSSCGEDCPYLRIVRLRDFSTGVWEPSKDRYCALFADVTLTRTIINDKNYYARCSKCRKAQKSLISAEVDMRMDICKS